MPSLPNHVIADIEQRLNAFLKQAGGFTDPKFLCAGGSAAIFQVQSPTGPRVIKGFDPSLIAAPSGNAELRRLNIQRRLIGHTCNSLVQAYGVNEAEGTAFVEMEFIEWPQLSLVLRDIPDQAVVPLITQLVESVRFLEAQQIVHRDIKPENIHVSPDFTRLKLLDLGVVREFELGEADAASITDHGNLRPFLATAQYSSPEYLFRLDEPSPRLWKGLNLYQVGAVLHDLIMKAPIFQQEVALGNRWLVARAVLTKTPSFTDTDPSRLASLKALSARCLVKDLDTRLQLVGWDEFLSQGGSDALATLRGRLARGRINTGGHARSAAEGRLTFERTEFVKRLGDRVRSELIGVCGTHLPLTTRTPSPDCPHKILFVFAANEQASIRCSLEVLWGQSLSEKTAQINMRAWIAISGDPIVTGPPMSRAIYSVVISEGEEEAITAISNEIAVIAMKGLDLIDASTELTALADLDLQTVGK